MHVETLEPRLLLAVMTVTDLGDDTLANLAGDGQLSLREAVKAISTGANVDDIGPTSGEYGTDDRIVFLSSLFDSGSQTLGLVDGQLELDREVVLMGPGQDLLTLDAQHNSRILQILQAEGDGDFTVAALTLTGGATTFDNPEGFTTYSGGAIRSLTSGNLTIDHGTITGNSTGGSHAAGGGVFALGNLSLAGSTVSNNSTAGDYAYGGGLFALGDVTLTGSTVSGNHTAGSTADGGGVYAYGNVAITRSTISGNHTTGSLAHGGGMYAAKDMKLTLSTISGNRTEGSESYGGGIYAPGSFSTPREITIVQSTITDNQALDTNATGGGIWNAFGPMVLDGSIVAGNTAGGGSPDLRLGVGAVIVRYSLIGNNKDTDLTEAPVGFPDTNGNLIGGPTGGIIDPLLGPLADNGGPTQTHALLPGSPAIDAGDPAIQHDPDQFDQRGHPFVRVADEDLLTVSAIDMGAYEAQAPPSADFDSDQDVDGIDFLAWQRGFGTTTGATKPDGDSDVDEDVDASDLAAWQSTFGETGPLGKINLPGSHALPSEVDSLSVPASAAWYVPRFQPTESMPWGNADFATFSQPFASGLPASRGMVSPVTDGALTYRETEQRVVSRASLAAGRSAGRLEHGPGGDEKVDQRMLGHAATDAVFALFGEMQDFSHDFKFGRRP